MMKATILDKLTHLMSVDAWLRLGEQALGMYYDLDSAILKELQIKDTQFSLTFDEDGALIADITYPFAVEVLDDLERRFYAIWSMVSFEFSIITREFSEDTITYGFITGTPQLGYKGSIIFSGAHIRQFLAERVTEGVTISE